MTICSQAELQQDIGMLGVALSNVENVPIHLNGVERKHLWLNSRELQTMLLQHYAIDGAKELYKVI